MEYSDELFEQVSLDQYVVDTLDGDVHVTVASEESCVADMALVIKMVISIASGEQFTTEGFKRGCLRLNKVGRSYLNALGIDTKSLIKVFKCNKLSQYVHVFDKARSAMHKKFYLPSVDVACLSVLEQLEVVSFVVEFISKAATNPVFKREMKNYERAIKKNEAGLNDFVDALFEKYSRLLVLRLDVGYSLPYLQAQRGTMSSERVKNDLASFLRAVKRGWLKDSLCGYIWKLEFGPTKQYHYHMMIFLDGSKHQEDIVLGEGLGEVWKNKITGGDGSYFNCNRDKKKYERCGVGMISWDDGQAVSNVKYAGSYLVKLDLLVKPNLPGNERTFGKSSFPKLKSSAGRPRRRSAI